MAEFMRCASETVARIDIKGARCLLHDILLELRPDHTFLISARAACLHYTASPHAKRRNVCEVPAARGTAAHLLLGGHHDSRSMTVTLAQTSAQR